VACLQIFFLTLPEGKPRYCSCQDPGYWQDHINWLFSAYLYYHIN
jgi:hypothetical protein